jgi:transcriptional regulator with XRE-family HTH domain
MSREKITKEILLIGQRIKMARKALKHSQKSFSKTLGISQGFLSYIENSQKIPGSEVIVLLKKHYDINPDWVLTGEGDFLVNGSDRVGGSMENSGGGWQQNIVMSGNKERFKQSINHGGSSQPPDVNPELAELVRLFEELPKSRKKDIIKMIKMYREES